MNCSEYLVDYLIKKGVADVFGYSGGYIVPLWMLYMLERMK